MTVRATPRGGRDAIDGLVELADGCQALKARVSVAAEDGKANAALAGLIAKAAGVAPSSVELLSRVTARLKTFRVKGDPAALATRFAALGG
nr:DUF167 family protein [Ancylobacter gelatini]